MTINDFLQTIPRYGHAAARIVIGMEKGEQGGALQDAIKQFDLADLIGMTYTFMNWIDPYKAPEQISPVANMIARHIIDERKKENK